MILADVNVLLQAFNPDGSEHGLCRSWLNQVTSGDRRFGMSPQVLSAVARIATHPRVFPRPTPVLDALRACDFLLQHPNCAVIQPGSRHWEIFSSLCIDADARGNLVADAWFAALAIEAGCEWITLDRDFARFKGLRWRTPS